MAEHKKHGEYIMELTTNQSIYKQIVAPQVAVAGSIPARIKLYTRPYRQKFRIPEGLFQGISLNG